MIFRKYSIYLALIGIFIALIFILRTQRPTPEAVYAQRPSASPYTHFIAGEGIVEAFDRNIAIGVPENALIHKLFVRAGDRVKKGEPLFELDPRQLNAELIVQKADVEVQQHQLNKQKDKLARYKAIEDPRAMTKEELQTLEDDLKIAEAKVNFAKASISKIELLLERLTVRAPGDGVILQVEIRDGEMASNSKPIILFGDLDRLQVRVDIDEELAGYFVKSQPAVAFPQNNTSISIPLQFVKVEPYVVPKKSLTGSSNERIDTRVLQVIYSFTPPKNYPIYVGQLVDVYIKKNEAAAPHEH